MPETPADYLSGLFKPGEIAAVFFPRENAFHDARLTEVHERVHSDLTYASTFGFFTWINGLLGTKHPDPILRYRFRAEVVPALTSACQAVHEGCAYSVEELAVDKSSPTNIEAWLKSVPVSERAAMRHFRRSIGALDLDVPLREACFTLLAELALDTPILVDWASTIPDAAALKRYLQQIAANPDARLARFANLGCRKRRSLRNTIWNSLERFQSETGADPVVVAAGRASLDRSQRGRQSYLLDEAVRYWLEREHPDLPIVPQKEREPQCQALLDAWRQMLPTDVAVQLPKSSAFVESFETYDLAKLAAAPPAGMDQLSRRIEDLSLFLDQATEQEYFISVLTRESYPAVRMPDLSEERLPPGWVQLHLSTIDTNKPIWFGETSAAVLPTANALAALRTWRPRDAIFLLSFEQVADRGGRILGYPRGDFPGRIRIVQQGLTSAAIPEYLGVLGSVQHPVHAYIIGSGPDESIFFLVARTDEWSDIEFLAPITHAARSEIQALTYPVWVRPCRTVELYQPDAVRARATAIACERIARFGH